MTKIILTALAMTLAPMAAYAECARDHAKMSCPQGQTWDTDSNSCIMMSS